LKDRPRLMRQRRPVARRVATDTASPNVFGERRE
jgi:hypothetical protein